MNLLLKLYLRAGRRAYHGDFEPEVTASPEIPYKLALNNGVRTRS